MFGIGRYGSAIAMNLKKSHYTILGVDYDPETVQRWRMHGIDSTYGDAWDFELLAQLPFKETRWVISAIPQAAFGIAQEDPRQALIEGLKKENYKGKIAVTAEHLEEAELLKKNGADLVFLPFYDAADRAVERMKEVESENL
jgi:Trk K+ transport system NAD-binding subunit